MYLPAHFAEARSEVLGQLIREQPFGMLVMGGPDGELSADGIPFLLDADPAGGPGILRAHVARANPLWRKALGEREVLVIFQGAQAYVSPGWYPSKAEHGQVVPTWNYIVVQARGRLRAIEDRDWLRVLVDRLTTRHEAPRARPWAMSDAPADYIETMLGAIVGIEIVTSALVGKWKVSQNRSAADRAGVAAGLEALAAPGTPARAEALALAAQVRTPGTPG